MVVLVLSTACPRMHMVGMFATLARISEQCLAHSSGAPAASCARARHLECGVSTGDVVSGRISKQNRRINFKIKLVHEAGKAAQKSIANYRRSPISIT